MQGPPLCIAGTPGGDGNSTHPSLRVPELCDDHIPPSCLVAYHFTKMEYRFVNTLVLPDPWLTQGGPVTFPACALHQAFRQVVRLSASWPVLFTCLCLYTPQLLAASALLCPFSLSLRALLDELQHMRLPLGTTGWNHSYYTDIPLSALYSLQQLQAGASSPSPVQILASTRESHGAASSSSVSCPQVPLKLGGLGVGSAVQRHAAAPWRAWQSIIPTLTATTQSPDTDSLFSATPRLRAQLAQLQTTLSQQMNKPTFQLKPLGAALKQVSTIQRNTHTNNSTTASSIHPLNKPYSCHNPLHIRVRISCSRAVKRMRLRIVAFVSQLPGD